VSQLQGGAAPVFVVPQHAVVEVPAPGAPQAADSGRCFLELAALLGRPAGVRTVEVRSAGQVLRKTIAELADSMRHKLVRCPSAGDLAACAVWLS
jgi:hypothetical protein